MLISMIQLAYTHGSISILAVCFHLLASILHLFWPTLGRLRNTPFLCVCPRLQVSFRAWRQKTMASSAFAIFSSRLANRVARLRFDPKAVLYLFPHRYLAVKDPPPTNKDSSQIRPVRCRWLKRRRRAHPLLPCKACLFR
ncbi:hypothetical protein GALMADRAFT_753507 [Galerina marginata CBS 339.88]|uniref:Uncharacterized protein n=1 Tax=Galerina marginata (strain CBS 339.88) TaxID=685588 RepID=A0A067T0L8_GALM3|nr:hypothetical protein GALMADRAFT_753507 [Galerina marginata CBS 339.88]